MRPMKSRTFQTLFTAASAIFGCLGMTAGCFAGEAQAPPITHSFLATGPETYILSGDGKVAWSFPHATRDGCVLLNGNVLLAVAKDSGDYPGGAAVEITRDGKVVFEYKGTQSEVDTVQLLDNGRVMLTESGPKPRLLELERDGTIAVEVPLQCQTDDPHMQTRMARKLSNGNYLVPHLRDMVVREYTPQGKIVWEVHTPNWPFTAIRLDNGNTQISCTVGNLLIEVDADGKTVWQVTNDDLPNQPIKDNCGSQRLPNGNTVMTSYRAGDADLKLYEVTRDKKIVWTYSDGKPHGIHHFQILDTNGQSLPSRALR